MSDLAHYDDIDTKSVGFVATVSAVLVFVTIVAAQVLYYNYQSGERQRKVLTSGDGEYGLTIKEQHGQMAEYSAVDAEQGVYAIPIQSAMELVVEEYKTEGGKKEDYSEKEKSHSADSDKSKSDHGDEHKSEESSSDA
ncbi:hypothetical protein [Calycomorphotria hydatis]|uniref:Uncharacterized protein n=1 Tax=Calycomorphotria hydatis TaxID=2528027 RepID=A0A517T8Y0_9PLAN|nr:hypothetical protein [Calycomorphotria hydatis]QDT64835.1 hypothetical protein V22_20780 [Calycomorphotria hydatis]